MMMEDWQASVKEIAGQLSFDFGGYFGSDTRLY